MGGTELIEAHIAWNKEMESKDDEELDGLASGIVLGGAGHTLGHIAGESVGGPIGGFVGGFVGGALGHIANKVWEAGESDSHDDSSI